jgi:hypothetical protein
MMHLPRLPYRKTKVWRKDVSVYTLGFTNAILTLLPSLRPVSLGPVISSAHRLAYIRCKLLGDADFKPLLSTSIRNVNSSGCLHTRVVKTSWHFPRSEGERSSCLHVLRNLSAYRGLPPHSGRPVKSLLESATGIRFPAGAAIFAFTSNSKKI